MQSKPITLTAALLIVGSAVAGITSTAQAEGRDRGLFGASIEGFGAKNLDDPNRDRYGFGVGGAGYLELRMLDWLGAHAGATGVWFSKNSPVIDTDGDGQFDQKDSTYFAGLSAGLRLHWSELLLDNADDGWVDFHFTYGGQESFRRPGLDAGFGYEFALNERGSVRLGPFVRVTWLRGPGGDIPTSVGDLRGSESPVWLNAGFSLGFGAGKDPVEEEEPGANDRDNDGVLDENDMCPDTPKGDHADPKRPGCPLADTDGDGVYDDKDQCLNTPKGDHPDPKRPGCPIADTDGDGVLDDIDMCPKTHHGPFPDKKRPGCPMLDTDGDSVPDVYDGCPNEAGAPSKDPKKNGCPTSVKVEKGQLTIIDKKLYFAFNKDVILKRSNPLLEDIAAALSAAEWIKLIRIEGHTDSQGSEEYNVDLSQRRADSVKRALIERGVPEKKLTTKGYGEERPIADNETKEGRAKNRRVEFHLMKAHEVGKR